MIVDEGRRRRGGEGGGGGEEKVEGLGVLYIARSNIASLLLRNARPTLHNK
jgi:hypothetical protein